MISIGPGKIKTSEIESAEKGQTICGFRFIRPKAPLVKRDGPGATSLPPEIRMLSDFLDEKALAEDQTTPMVVIIRLQEKRNKEVTS